MYLDELLAMTNYQICRVCSCTEEDCSGCIERTGVPCFWVEEDLCSACVGEVKAAAVTFHFQDAKGTGQTMTFEMDLTIGCDEQEQLAAQCEAALLDKSFYNTTSHKTIYKLLKDI